MCLGGLGNMRGSDHRRGAAHGCCPRLLRSFADYRMLIYAIVLILVMLATNNAPHFKALLRQRDPRTARRRGEDV